MADLQFELVSPERLLMSGPVSAVTLPGSEGEFQVMAGHAPLLALLGPGVMTVESGSGRDRYFIDGGFCDVGAEGCTVLAERAYGTDQDGLAALDRIIADAETAAGDASGAERDVAERRLATLKTVRAAF